MLPDTVCLAPPGMNEVTANYSLSDYSMMVSTRIFSNSMARTIAALLKSVQEPALQFVMFVCFLIEVDSQPQSIASQIFARIRKVEFQNAAGMGGGTHSEEAQATNLGLWLEVRPCNRPFTCELATRQRAKSRHN